MIRRDEAYIEQMTINQVEEVETDRGTRRYKNLVIGCSDGYEWDQLKYWVNSIRKTGYRGDVALVVLNGSAETLEELAAHKVQAITLNKDGFGNAYHNSPIPVHVERFLHIYNHLRNCVGVYRYVLTTDVRDVVFQRNPFTYLQELNKSKVLYCSESLKYKDEPWGYNNILEGYGPYIQEMMAEEPIYNVGIFGGVYQYVRDLCLDIFLGSINRPIPIVDQATYNVLLRNQFYRVLGVLSTGRHSWACNLGTTMDPSKIDSFRPHLLDPEPILDGDTVCNHEGKPYFIVHQYDRVPGLREAIYDKFGGD